MIGASDLILQTPLNAEQKDLVKILRNSGHILLKLIEDVLDDHLQADRTEDEVPAARSAVAARYVIFRFTISRGLQR